jgi:hypothetical protein
MNPGLRTLILRHGLLSVIDISDSPEPDWRHSAGRVPQKPSLLCCRRRSRPSAALVGSFGRSDVYLKCTSLMTAELVTDRYSSRHRWDSVKFRVSKYYGARSDGY